MQGGIARGQPASFAVSSNLYNTFVRVLVVHLLAVSDLVKLGAIANFLKVGTWVLDHFKHSQIHAAIAVKS